MSKLQNFNGHFCESEYEYAFITFLEREGWQYLQGNKINRQTRKDVLYSNDLERFLTETNPDLLPDEIHSIIDSVRLVGAENDFATLHKVYGWTIDGVQFTPQSGTPRMVALIDYENPGNNIFRCVNQFTVEYVNNGLKQTRRPDVLLFVNGLPLCVIELKNPANANATIYDAWEQINIRYWRDIPHLLHYCPLACISDGVKTRVGTVRTPYEHFYAWRRVNDGDEVVFPETVKDAEDITQDQMILQSVNDTYRSGNVMGFLGYGDERLVIESRFCGEGEDYFFQYLLDKVLDFPNIVDLDADANQDNRLFNFLLFLFPYYLKAAMRKGLFKKYIRHRYNDGNVKGTIDVARHIEKNTPFVGNVAYSQREFSYDNSLMELVRHTVEFIKRKPYGNKLLIKVKDEVKLVIDATPEYEPYDRQKIIEQNKKNTVRHAYFREYLALQRLCLLILRHQRHQIGTGARQIYGILFDGAWLWEEYVNSLIEDVFYHPMNKGGKGAQRLFDGNVGLIYPDFISRNSETRIIADAKYKPVDNIGNRDYLQVLAYMFRFDAKTGYYLYPEAEGSDDLKLRMNCGSTYEKNVMPRDDISLTKHGLKIPVDALNYAEFSVRMKTCEQEFKSALIF